MNVNIILLSLRKLAKTDNWQTLYSLAKELHLQLFQNVYNFTSIQITFLNFLAFYNNLYLDIAMRDIDEIVLENFIYEDAYMYWKRKNIPSYKQDKISPSQTTQQGINWVFKRPKQ